MALTPQDRARNLLVREVAKRLRKSKKLVLAMVHRGELQATRKGQYLLFPREVTERAIDRMLADDGKLVLDEGVRDARAVAMLRAGHSDADVVAELAITLERTERLRRAQGPSVADTRPTAAIDPAREREEWERRRRQRNERWNQRRKEVS